MKVWLIVQKFKDRKIKFYHLVVSLQAYHEQDGENQNNKNVANITLSLKMNKKSKQYKSIQCQTDKVVNYLQ